MYRIPAIKRICDVAYKCAEKLGPLPGSIREGEGNHIGYIFQIAYAMLYNSEWSDAFNYDLVSSCIKKMKLELKCKERTIHYFEPSWEVSIAADRGLGTNQQCDKYVFGNVSVNKQKEPLWIWFLGEMSKREYFEGQVSGPQKEGDVDFHGRPLKRWKDLVDGAEFREKGVIYDNNKFKCKANCWNRRIDELDPLRARDVPNKLKLRKIIQQSRKEKCGHILIDGKLINPVEKLLCEK